MKLFKRILGFALLFGFMLEISAVAQTNWTSIFSNSANAKPKVFPRRASIIFIQVDGLGYGDLSCYGQTKYQTPNLDKLAAEGIRFTNYSVSAAASSSHASLMTGKNPSHLRQRSDVEVPLAFDEITIAQILKSTGYHTGLIGLWDLGAENSSGVPWQKGFDEFAGYLDSADAQNFYADYVDRYAPHAILNDTNKQMENFVGREMIYYNTGGKKGQYIPDVLAKAAANFVKNNQPDAFNHYKPFFLLLNFKIPDTNVMVPSDAPFSEEPWSQAEKNRAAFIARLDNYVGQLRDQLNLLRMTNNVVIFFASATTPKKSSDSDPKFFHSNISPNDLRAPLIANWSGKISAGSASGLNCSPQDFLPTATDIALFDMPTNIDGRSFLIELIGKKSPAP